MTPEDKRNSIMYQMSKNLADGIHTMNACKCGRGKRGGTEACVCCLADMLREVEGGKSPKQEYHDRAKALSIDFTHQMNVKDVKIVGLEAKIERLSSRGIEDMQFTIERLYAEKAKLTADLKQMSDLYQGTLP